jgi:hypothetical protein
MMVLTAHQLEVFDALEIANGEFGEDVVLHVIGGDDETVKALVTLNEPIRDHAGDEPAEYTGHMRYPAAEKSKLGLEDTPVLTATIRGETWHIVDVGTDSYGYLPIGIRRRAAQNKHTNMHDLDDEQAQWAN